jgi:hypothetical protein
MNYFLLLGLCLPQPAGVGKRRPNKTLYSAAVLGYPSTVTSRQKWFYISTFPC